MSSFKKADGIIDSIQKQATGLRTLDGSAIEDFLSIAGYEKSAGGGGGGVGYDAELYIYHGAGSGDYDVSIVSGSFAELSELLDAEIPPNILVRFWDEALNTKVTTTIVPLYSYDSEQETPAMIFHVKVPKLSPSSTYSDAWMNLTYLTWTANDEVTLN